MSKSESGYHFVTQSAVEGSPAPFVGDVFGSALLRFLPFPSEKNLPTRVGKPSEGPGDLPTRVGSISGSSGDPPTRVGNTSGGSGGRQHVLAAE